ncbi:hypothetical protein CDBH8_2030 [Corynebacterium diphtheriae BH8]|nr:hypothetical protein CDBH8_2030 [Corynebacterium diphtheriae BH8]
MPLHGQHLSALRVLEAEKEGEQLTSQSLDHAKEGFIFGFSPARTLRLLPHSLRRFA